MNEINTTTTDNLYDDIAERILMLSENSISKEQAKSGAKRFVKLCKKLVDIEIRIEAEKKRSEMKIKDKESRR